MAMRAGKPCLIEKPLAASYEDCVRINRVSEQTGVPCFVVLLSSLSALFQEGERDFAVWRNRQGAYDADHALPCSQRNSKTTNRTSCRGDCSPQEAGRGYFYDLAPHQIDLLQSLFGVIVKAHGYTANRTGLYEVEDTVNAVFRFESGLCGSGSWSFTAHESAKEDCIEIYGTKGRVIFSIYNYEPITLYTSEVCNTST